MLIDLQDFGGELPSLDYKDLPTGNATYAMDVDFGLGTLKPFQTDRKASDVTGESIWSDDCCYLAGDCNTTFAQADIGCQYVFKAGCGSPMYGSYLDACAGNWCRIDYPCTFPAPSASSLSTVEKDFDYETVMVVYTFINKYGHESHPSYPSVSFEMNDGGGIAVGGLPTVDDGYCWEKVRIYASRSTLELPGSKTKKSDGFFLLGEVSFGTSAAVLTYGAPGDKLLTDDSDPLPTEAWDIAHQRSGHLSAIVNNTVRFSERNQWTSWPEDYMMNVPGTALRHLAGREWGYVLTDERYLAIKLDLECGGKRCHQAFESNAILPLVAHRSAAMYGDSIVYASHEGLVMAYGREHKIVSRPFFDKHSWHQLKPQTLIGVVHKGYYFGKSEEMCFRMPLPGSIFTEEKPIGGLTRLSINPIAFHETRDGKLLFATDSGTYEWNAGDDFKPYVWERKYWEAPGRVGFSSWKIDGKYGYSDKVEHYSGASAIQTKDGKSKDAIKLPICKSDKWGVRIEGKSEVTRYRLGTSVQELNK